MIDDVTRAELDEWRRRAEVAEALAAERADALADIRAALIVEREWLERLSSLLL